MRRFLPATMALVYALSFVPYSDLHSSVLHSSKKSTKKSRTARVKAEPNLYLYGATIVSAPVPVPQESQGVLSDKDIRIINLGPVVNFSEVDYAPTVSADGKTLFFVSQRPGSKLNKDGDPSHDFFAAKKNANLDTTFSKPYNIDAGNELGDAGVNTSRNEGAASIAADRQTLVFTGCNRPDGLGKCDLYITDIEGDKWARPRNLGRNVNTEYWESQPSIAPDKSRIYFISNRPGPHGDDNFDIWYTDYDFDSEEWKPAANLKALNTAGKEQAPFIGADNSSLFFSSDTHQPNFGGLDFYVAKRDQRDSWTKPNNIGKPINTDADDFFISLPASGDVLYFSSRRTDIPGYSGDIDLFMAFVPSFFRAVNLITSVYDECSGSKIPASVSIKNITTNKIFRDSVGTAKTESQLIISNNDYGRPEDSLKSVDIHITVSNPQYGQKDTTITVARPAEVRKKEEATTDEVRVEIAMGQRPVIGSEIAFSDYVKNYKGDDASVRNFKGLVMQEVATFDLFPLLNYVFFDEGSSTIPSRYVLFRDPNQKTAFNDEKIPGGTLQKYYNILNIFGYRLTKHPDVKIKVVGTNDANTPAEKRPGLSKERAQQVYDYLHNIWGISKDRMELVARDLPEVVSNLKDSLGIKENRRVEIQTDNWNIIRPIFERDPKIFPTPETMTFTLKNGVDDNIIASRRIEVTHDGKSWKTVSNPGTITASSYTWDWQNTDLEYPGKGDEKPFEARLVVTSKNGAECISNPITIPVKQVQLDVRNITKGEAKTREKYNLVLFPFNSYAAGPINERILREYVFNRVVKSSDIQVEGHTDVVGMETANQKLSENRAKTVSDAIRSASKGQFNSLSSKGVGEGSTPEEILYDNQLPEGRFYNRTVQVQIQTPLEDAPKE